MNTSAVSLALAESAALCRQAHVRVAEVFQRVESTRARVREQTARNAARSRLLLIRRQLEDGGLPNDRPTIVLGAPGGGERCASCGSVLTPGQLAMSISSAEAVFYLDADCYQVWEALRRRRG